MINEKLKPLGILGIIFTILCLSVSALFVSPLTANGAPINNSTAVKNGSLIKATNSDDVYIVKIEGDKRYKRLILNPRILDSYGHLNWNNIVTVSESTLSRYKTSQFIQTQGSEKVYELRASKNSDTGVKHWVNLTKDQFLQAGFDPDSIFTVNRIEGSSAFYTLGSPRTTAYYPKLRVKHSAKDNIFVVSSSPKTQNNTKKQSVVLSTTPKSKSHGAKIILQSKNRNNNLVVVNSQPKTTTTTRTQSQGARTTTTTTTVKESVLPVQVNDELPPTSVPAQSPVARPQPAPTPAPAPVPTPAPAPVAAPAPSWTGSKFIPQQTLLHEISKYNWDSNMAYRIAVCESSRNVYALNNTPGREYSVGLFQINLKAHRHLNEQTLYNPIENIRQAHKIYQQAGWRAWLNCYRKVSG